MMNEWWRVVAKHKTVEKADMDQIQKEFEPPPKGRDAICNITQKRRKEKRMGTQKKRRAGNKREPLHTSRTKITPQVGTNQKIQMKKATSTRKRSHELKREGKKTKVGRRRNGERPRVEKKSI